MPRSKRGKTGYWGTAGIFVSNKTEESPESAQLYADMTKMWADGKDLGGLDNMLRQRIMQMPRVLTTSKPIDLNAEVNALQKYTLAGLAQTVLDCLRVLQSAEMPVTELTSAKGRKMAFVKGKDLEDGKAADPFTDVELFLTALQDFNTAFNQVSQRSTYISEEDWKKVKDRFFLKSPGGNRSKYGKNQIFYAAAHRIMGQTSDLTTNDYGTIYGAIRGQFGNSIGQLMEGVIADIISMPAIQKKLYTMVNKNMIDMADGVVANVERTGKDGALSGTLRYTSVVKFTDKKDSSQQYIGKQGQRLADNLITLTPTGNGATMTIGLSIKNLNFYSDYYHFSEGGFSIGSISLGKFAPVFSNLRANKLTQRVGNKGQYALYGYRALNEKGGHDDNSPILRYLLAHRVAEIAFGTALDSKTSGFGSDFSPLMSINGKLWNTRDYLLSNGSEGWGGNLHISVSKYPKDQIPQTWWMPQQALGYVSLIHGANIDVQLRFGQSNAIKKFMN